MKKYLGLIVFLHLVVSFSFANNIQIENAVVTDDNPLQGYAKVQFDLSWQNSWRITSGPNNWDAAWVFVKYRVSGGNWQHAFLHNDNHSEGIGTSCTIVTGLLNDKITYNSATNPGVGAIIYRATTGTGTFNVTNLQLRWNYSENGISGPTDVEIKVFAIEMVLVRGGNFWLGDGFSTGSFRQVSQDSPYSVNTSGGALKVNNTPYDDNQLENDGIWVDGDGGVSRSAPTETDMNIDFPTGYRGFYCMKYEISQGQYRDFLNSLTRIQQNSRTTSDISGTYVTNRYLMSNSPILFKRNSLRCDSIIPMSGPVEIYCDLDGDGIKNEANDGEWIACNHLGWGDGIAYLDWSGLRPMTELEFEKACRGHLEPKSGEYAWGTNEIAASGYSISNGGSAAEGISSNFSNNFGNAIYFLTDGGIDGPLRVGIFASNLANSSRISSGAGYFGVMELSGNVWERCVTLGNEGGRNFIGLHGDGTIDGQGESNVSHWPGANGYGGGLRGGAIYVGSSYLSVSDRGNASWSTYYRLYDDGIRGVRSVPPSNEGY